MPGAGPALPPSSWGSPGGEGMSRPTPPAAGPTPGLPGGLCTFCFAEKNLPLIFTFFFDAIILFPLAP